MSFYPINPDTAVESFILTDYKTQVDYLGRSYNIKELVPINYTKVALACAADVLTYAPLREYLHITPNPQKANEISNERANDYQSLNLKNALAEILQYWESDLLGVPVFQCPMGVITEITTNVIPNASGTDFPTGNRFNIVTKLKIEWYVIPGSLYS